MKKGIKFSLIGLVFIMIFIVAIVNAEELVPLTTSINGCENRASTHYISESALLAGYNIDIGENDRLYMRVFGDDYYICINILDNSSIDLQVSSTSINSLLYINNTTKWDFANDGYYDLLFKLNSINSSISSANVYLKNIYEKINQSTECGDTITKDTILTSDLLNCSGHGLIIGANNITLDCNGHSIQAKNKGNYYFGVYINNYKREIYVKNCSISNFHNGIYLDNSRNNYILNNDLHENSNAGIYLVSSFNNIINNNIAYKNYRGIYLISSGNNIITENKANSNTNCPTSDNWCDGFGIVLSSSSDNLLYKNEAKTNPFSGIFLTKSSNNNLTENLVNDNSNYGISLWDISSYNYLSGNSVNNNYGNGIQIFDSSMNNTITENTIIRGPYYCLFKCPPTTPECVSCYESISIDENSLNNKIWKNNLYFGGIGNNMEQLGNVDPKKNIYCIDGVGNYYYNDSVGPICEIVECIPNIINTDFTNWINLSCLSNNKMNQSRFLVQYDSKNCPNSTNKTIYEYRAIVPCKNCTPNLTNSSWSNWINQSCLLNNHMNQSRFLTQYDINNCGEIENKTIFELRATIHCNSSTNQAFLSQNSPKEGIYNDRTVEFNVSSTLKFSKIVYSDNSGRESTLCTNCYEYVMQKTLDDGTHTLVGRGILPDGSSLTNQTKLFIDSKEPQISSIKPQSRRYTNGSDFYIKYTEDNCKTLKLLINSQEILSIPCESVKNIEKVTPVNINQFNGLDVEYKFILIDIADNTKESRLTKIKVDTTAPQINDFKAPVAGRYVYFNMTLLNEDKNSFNKIDYLDSFDGTRARWKNICTSLKSNVCYKKVYFGTGNHNIVIRATDKAGNSNTQLLDFNI